jgi:hypothetical protein
MSSSSFGSGSETETDDEDVAYKKQKGKKRQMTEDEDDEERHQAPVREKKSRRDEKDEDRKKMRDPPKTTGRLRKTICSRCHRKGLECLVQVGGRACVACAKLKVRCIEVGEEEIPAASEKPAKKAPAPAAPPKQPTIKSKPRKKAPAKPISPPPPPKKRQQTKKTVKSVGTIVDDEGTGGDERPRKKQRTFAELSRGSGKFGSFSDS